MTFNTVFSLSISTLIVWLLIAQPGFGVPEKVPPDVLKLRPGGYVYADYPGVFDDVEGDGITIEAWIYLTERPKEANVGNDGFLGGWIIFAKPGSYFVTVIGRDGTWLTPRPPAGQAHIFFGVQRPNRNHEITLRIIPPGEFPFRRWVHVAYQIVVKRDVTDKISFYDGEYMQKGLPFEGAMGRTAAPLLIGGATLVTLENGWKWGRANESMKGYIDEVRVSKGWRYAQGADIHPKRHFRADGRTIALWRFEEGPGAPFYADSSGNDYTLVAGGSLAVHPHGKLATTWGSLKRRTQF